MWPGKAASKLFDLLSNVPVHVPLGAPRDGWLGVGIWRLSCNARDRWPSGCKLRKKLIEFRLRISFKLPNSTRATFSATLAIPWTETGWGDVSLSETPGRVLNGNLYLLLYALLYITFGVSWSFQIKAVNALIKRTPKKHFNRKANEGFGRSARRKKRTKSREEVYDHWLNLNRKKHGEKLKCLKHVSDHEDRRANNVGPLLGSGSSRSNA